MLVRNGERQFHLGLRYRGDPAEQTLHLGWHRSLQSERLEEMLRAGTGATTSRGAVIAFSIDPAVDELLSGLVERIADLYADDATPIAYGFGDADATFDPITGALTDPDGAFTCATFVLAVLRSVGVVLIDADRFRPPTDEDLRWQQEIGEKLLDWIARRFHGDLVRATQRVADDLGSLRHRPTDVAAAALLGPEAWPAGADAITSHAAALEARLT